MYEDEELRVLLDFAASAADTLDAGLAELTPAIDLLAAAAVDGALQPSDTEDTEEAIQILSGRLREAARALGRIVDTAAIVTDMLPESFPEQAIEFDGNETYDIVRRFVALRSGIPFSLGELQKHLEMNSVVGVPQGPKLRSWLIANQPDLRDDVLDQNGIDGRWADLTIGRATGFVFAPIRKRSTAQTTESPTPGSYSAASDISQEEPKQEAKVDPLSDGIIAAVMAGSVRRNALINTLEQGGTPRGQAVAAITWLTEKGELFPFREQGELMVTANQAEAESSELASRRTSGRTNKEIVRTEQNLDVELAEAILEAFIQPGSHTSWFKSPRELLRLISADDSLANDNNATLAVTKTARTLEKIGILAKESRAMNNGGGRPASRTPLKFGLASKDLRNIILAAKGKGTIGSLIREALENTP